MPPKIALALCLIFVIGLLRIERKSNPDASWALWIPTIWLCICASRPVGSWFASGGTTTPSNLSAGNPINQVTLGILFTLTIFVSVSRNVRIGVFIKNNKWLFLLYLYMGLSSIWSDSPSVSLRRWIKVSMALAFPLVILAEQSPAKSLETIFRRISYILVPFSMLLIKYYPYLGRQYNRWTGQLMWTGVAGQKNGLGFLCAFSIFFIVWSYVRQRVQKRERKTYPLKSDIIIACLASYLLLGNPNSYSATAIVVLIVGTGLLLILNRSEFIFAWISERIQGIIVGSVLLYAFLNAKLLPVITALLDRDVTLTGRDEIWKTTMEVASQHQIFGIGYGNLAFEETLYSLHGVLQPHNGFLGVYVYLGLIGLVLLGAFIFSFCDVIKKMHLQPEWRMFCICFLFMLLLYNYSEASFLQNSTIWTVTIFLATTFSGDKSLRVG